MFGVSGPPGPFDIPHYTAAKHGKYTDYLGLVLFINIISGGWLDKDGKIYLSIYLNLVTWLTQNRTRKHIRDKEFASMPSVPGMSLANSLYYKWNLTDINSFVDTPIIKQQIESGSMNPAFEMTPVGRPAQVEEISDAILFLSSPMSSYMCGAAMVVDGGFTV